MLVALGLTTITPSCCGRKVRKVNRASKSSVTDVASAVDPTTLIVTNPPTQFRLKLTRDRWMTLGSMALSLAVMRSDLAGSVAKLQRSPCVEESAPRKFTLRVFDGGKPWPPGGATTVTGRSIFGIVAVQESARMESLSISRQLLASDRGLFQSSPAASPVSCRLAMVTNPRTRQRPLRAFLPAICGGWDRATGGLSPAFQKAGVLRLGRVSAMAKGGPGRFFLASRIPHQQTPEKFYEATGKKSRHSESGTGPIFRGSFWRNHA